MEPNPGQWERWTVKMRRRSMLWPLRSGHCNGEAPYWITGPIPHCIRFDHEDGGIRFLELNHVPKALKVLIKTQTAIETASCSFTNPKPSVVLRTVVPQYRIKLRSGGTRVTFITSNLVPVNRSGSLVSVFSSASYSDDFHFSIIIGFLTACCLMQTNLMFTPVQGWI